MSLTCEMVEQQLRNEMVALTLPELKRFAIDMGLESQELDELEDDRDEIANACVMLELYAFTH